MNSNKLSIRFVIIKAKINRRCLCALSCRLTFKSKRKAFSTGLFVNPNNWNAKQQIMIDSSDSMVFNAQLEFICFKLKKVYLLLQLEGPDFTVDDIYQNYIGNPVKKKEHVVTYFRNYLSKIDKLIGKDLELATWNKYYYSCNQVEQFIKWKYKKNDYLLQDLKPQFLVDFDYYLKTELNQVQVTVNKTIQRFRKPIIVAVAEGSLDKDPFVLYKPGKVRKEVVFLSPDELNILENHTFNQPRLELVKDLFVFCCYTGLAYHEMSHLKKEHIIKGFDGNEWIQMKRKKTSKLISIPLLPKPKDIILKYNQETENVLPRFSNQKINSYLKEIAEIVGIDKSISHHMARKTFASTVLLYNDVPMEIVSELLGHSSIKITQDYYGKVVQKRVSQEILRLARNVQLK
jgi:integrase